jgi:hypothetical protein
MKKILPVVFTLFFILTGCAAREDQTASQHDEMTEIQGPERGETVSDVPVEKSMEHELDTTEAVLPNNLDYSPAKLSLNGVYNISYKSIGGDIRINRAHSWELTVRDADNKPVNNARVLLSAKMPVQERSLSVHPVISRAGFGGLYRIDNMKFDMPGWWVVTINIMADNIPDRTSFNINISD